MAWRGRVGGRIGDRSLVRRLALAALITFVIPVGVFAQPGAVIDQHKFSDESGGFGGVLSNSDRFGSAVGSLGDLNGDGTDDLMVGALGDDDGGTDRGAVWILFLSPAGFVASETKISSTQGGLAAVLDDEDSFGIGLGTIGDLDGDGVVDVAVGASMDDDGGVDRGAVYILFLNADGSVQREQKISSTTGGFGAGLANRDEFGVSVSPLGDLDGDGIVDLAVGALRDDDGGSNTGAVWILFLNRDGTVKAKQKISPTAGGFSGNLSDEDLFGISVAGLGDLDGDGIEDLAVGATFDDDGGPNRGAVYILFLRVDGTVRRTRKISEFDGGFEGAISDGALFGKSLARLEDLDADGVTELAVGVRRDDDGGNDRGAVFILFLEPGGSVKDELKISSLTPGLSGGLDNGDQFGTSVARVGDLDGDGGDELAVGAQGDDDGGNARGAVWLLSLERPCGNGELDPGEECDDGNTVSGDCCSSMCLFEASGASCEDDANECTDDVCDGAGSCSHLANLDPCDDGLFCNGLDRCAAGSCSDHDGDPCAGASDCADVCDEVADSCLEPAGTACDDEGNECTDDVCDGAGTCTHPDNAASCDDGLFCNGADSCTGGACSVHAGDPCVGGGECSDTCDEGADSCNLASGVACSDDGNGCTDDVCDGLGACSHPANAAPCDDGIFCNGIDSCGGGTCSVHLGDPCRGGDDCREVCNEGPRNCLAPPGFSCTDDGEPCTNDVCDGAGGCTHPNNTSSCDDGIFCNGPDTCLNGSCSVHPGDPCVGGGECANSCDEVGATCSLVAGTACGDDGNLCTDDVCDGDGTCAHPPNSLPCDDGLFCTVADTCAGGACVGTPRTCDDGNQCTADVCDELGGVCSNTDTVDPCDDGDPCTVDDVCSLGVCAGVAKDCSAFDDDCYVGQCDADSGACEPEPMLDRSACDVAGETKISDLFGTFDGTLVDGDFFGCSVADIGDIDGDGIGDLAVGAPFSDEETRRRGAVWIVFLNPDGTAKGELRVGPADGGFSGFLDDDDAFGFSVAGVSDINADGNSDLVVGALADDDGGVDRGAVWVLFLDTDGSVLGHTKVSDEVGGFDGVLDDEDFFGDAVTAFDDLDGDGTPDLAVGAPHDDDGGPDRGAVWVLFLNADGSVRESRKIASGQGGFAGVLSDNDLFGSSVASPGDLNGDGVDDLLVGAVRDDDGGTDRGAVWVLFLNPDGTVLGETKISNLAGGFGGTLDNADGFGASVAGLGDLDRDGFLDVIVGAAGDDDAGPGRGAAWLLNLSADGRVLSETKISDLQGGLGGDLDDFDQFGVGVAGIGDLNGDAVPDLVVGALGDDDGGTDRGAVWVIFLNNACGNGDLDPGEECDDGNSVNGDCCAANCLLEAQGSPCDDGVFCNGADTCDGGGGCSDHLGDPCAANGECSDLCDEGLDTCDRPDGTSCDDALFCNGADSCLAGECAAHSGDPCIGGAECQATCDENADGCLADSGTLCTDDANECTDDICDGAGSCVHPPNAAACDDGIFCNGADLCDSGACTVHAGDPCASAGECGMVCSEAGAVCDIPFGTPCTDDGNVCTDDACDGRGMCAHLPNSMACDDGLFCTLVDTCTGGACVGSGDPCAAGADCSSSCDEAVDGCLAPVGTACTDDGNPCTDGACDGSGACVHTPNSAPCDDGVFCNGTDTCAAGSCSVHAGDPCVGGPTCADTCNELRSTCAVPDGTACDDGVFCTAETFCAGGQCLGGRNPCGDAPGCGDTCSERDGDCRLCGHPVSNQLCVVNAVFILQGAIDLVTCELCVCDVDSSTVVTPSDALAVLKSCVGIDQEFICPDFPAGPGTRAAGVTTLPLPTSTTLAVWPSTTLAP